MAERPKDLIYALNERPHVLQLLALGFQHAAVICPYLVMVALVAGAAKLPHDEARDAMGLAMIAVGFLTILQSLRLGGGRFGIPLSACRLGNLPSFEHGCRVGFRISRRLWDGDVCRRMRGPGSPAR